MKKNFDYSLYPSNRKKDVSDMFSVEFRPMEKRKDDYLAAGFLVGFIIILAVICSNV